MAEKSGVQSVERIFQLIEHLAAHPTGVSLQRLAEETGLAKSTVHRLLASLVGLGYVVQDEENGHYRLTLKMFELSSGIVDSMDIMGVAKAHLERLSQRTGEAVHLVIRDGRDIVYIYKTESGPMRMSSRVGLRSPLYCTGVGKAILATLPGDELEDIWTHSNVQKLTDKTITDLEELRSQLVEVRRERLRHRRRGERAGRALCGGGDSRGGRARGKCVFHQRSGTLYDARANSPHRHAGAGCTNGYSGGFRAALKF